DLQRRHTNELGHLPTAALAWHLENSTVLLALQNDDAAGYLLGRSHLRAQPWVRPITQAAIRYDARRRHHGLALVEVLARDAWKAGQSILQCWCAADLEANQFWLAAG